MSVKVECIVTNAATTLGEGPHWDESTKCLLHVDINSNNLHRWNSVTRKDEKVVFDKAISFVIPCRKGGFILGLGKTLCHFDWNTKTTEILHEVDKGTRNRFNDAKCDAKGRLWAGTMGYFLNEQPQRVENTGHLFSLEVDGTLKTRLDGIHISNGMAWSANNKIMYYIDTLPRKVYALDYDIDTGNICNQRIAVDFARRTIEEYGVPDGMTIDTDDMIWVAGPLSGRIFRFNPSTGEEIFSVKFPVLMMTSCCFGGENYDELYVTSAVETEKGKGVEELQRYPLSGSVFRVTGLGVNGLPPYIYEG